MTPTTTPAQPEALRLADAITNLMCSNESAARTIPAAADELVRLHAQVAALTAAPGVPDDPMDWPLPCDLKAGGVTISKGCPLRTVQTRLKIQSEANALLMRNHANLTAQLAAPAQPAEGTAYVEKPAEIEHVADDMSKNGAESNMTGAAYAELPARRRSFFCTKCGGRECEPNTLEQAHPVCKCGYMGFAEDLDYTADQMRDFADRTHALRASHGQAPAETSHERALEDALRERDEADEFSDALLDEVLGSDRAEWSSAYGRAEALEEV